METESKGPVHSEIEERLLSELSPTVLNVINDSAQHSGHVGDDGSGESHFTVEIESEAFAGKSRVEMQRMVNRALGDMMKEKIHALAIKTRVPSASVQD